MTEYIICRNSLDSWNNNSLGMFGAHFTWSLRKMGRKIGTKKWLGKKCRRGCAHQMPHDTMRMSYGNWTGSSCHCVRPTCLLSFCGVTSPSLMMQMKNFVYSVWKVRLWRSQLDSGKNACNIITRSGYEAPFMYWQRGHFMEQVLTNTNSDNVHSSGTNSTNSFKITNLNLRLCHFITKSI